MPLYFKEYLNAEVSKQSSDIKTMDLKENLQTNPAIADPNAVIAEIEGLHNVVTRNNTLYTEKAMRSSVQSWTYPYEKAVILHHDENGGEVIGRIKDCSVEDSTVKPGAKSLNLVAQILEEKNKESTLDGRNKTVSVGVIAYDVTCSICGHQLSDGTECEHERGGVYDNEVCHWIINDMSAKELSFVNVPSDNYAQVTKAYKASSNNKGVKDGVNEMSESKKQTTLDLTESKDLETKEAKIIDNNGIDTNAAKEDPIVQESEEAVIIKLHKEKKELKAELEAKDLLIEEVKEELEAIKEKVEKLKEELVTKEDQITKEQSLRESLESQLNKHEVAIKENLVTEVSNLRESLGLETNIDSFRERSIESLNDSILDLKEQVDNSVNNIGTVLNESLVNEAQEKELISKKAKTEENKIQPALNLQEKLGSIFNN